MISSIFFYIFLRSYDVRRDALTSVRSRQTLYDDCAGTMQKDFCAAASLDMNGLKELNNHDGYHAGDAALQKIGEYLRDVSPVGRGACRRGWVRGPAPQPCSTPWQARASGGLEAGRPLKLKAGQAGGLGSW